MICVWEESQGAFRSVWVRKRTARFGDRESRSAPKWI
jgi:hypothetical protein